MIRRFSICCLLVATLLTACSCRQKQDGGTVIRIACVGNSITQGVTIANEHRDSYPGLLQQMLGAGYEVRNYGFSGRTLLDRGDRPYMKEQMYRDALNFCPDIVTVKLGTNDTKPWNWQYKEEFPVNLETMVNAFKALPSHPAIYLCYPVPAYRLDWGINDSVIHTEVQAYIRQVAEKTGAGIIDLYSPLEGRPELFTDRIHPTKEGALVIAGVLYEALTGRTPDAAFTPQEYPGVKSTLEGYDCYSFNFKERHGRLVVPSVKARVAEEGGGRPWIWRPDLSCGLSRVDKSLLEQGFFLVSYDVAGESDAEASADAGDRLYKYLTKSYGLSRKMVLAGTGCGNAYALRWAGVCPHKVGCLYLDTPDLAACPADGFEPMVQRRVPMVLVANEKDKTVPYRGNGALLVEKYRAAGGYADALLRSDSRRSKREDPSPVVTLILKHYPIVFE